MTNTPKLGREEKGRVANCCPTDHIRYTGEFDKLRGASSHALHASTVKSEFYNSIDAVVRASVNAGKYGDHYPIRVENAGRDDPRYIIEYIREASRILADIAENEHMLFNVRKWKD